MIILISEQCLSHRLHRLHIPVRLRLLRHCRPGICKHHNRLRAERVVNRERRAYSIAGRNLPSLREHHHYQNHDLFLLQHYHAGASELSSSRTELFHHLSL